MWLTLKQNNQDYEEFKALVNTHYHLKQLVFTDKSHFNQLTLRRPFTWSICDKHIFQYKFLLYRTKYSILSALFLDGIVHLKIVKNTVTDNDFQHFI